MLPSVSECFSCSRLVERLLWRLLIGQSQRTACLIYRAVTSTFLSLLHLKKNKQLLLGFTGFNELNALKVCLAEDRKATMKHRDFKMKHRCTGMSFLQMMNKPL